METEKKRVGLIFGGRSGEHEVSILSADSVMVAIDRQKYEVFPIYISREGKWTAGVEPSLVSRGDRTLIDGEEMTLLLDPAKGGFYAGGRSIALDVIIPILHGTYGEDGTIQGLLEMAGVPYVGCGVLASSLGMDKGAAKDVFAHHGLPQGDYFTCLRKDWEKDKNGVISQVESRFGYPCFVKPANLGSSVGISRPQSRTELERAVGKALLYDRKVVLEENIVGREVEVSVLGNDEPRASLPGEIIPGNIFYDYEAKYVDGKSELVIPVPLPPHITEMLQSLAVKAFKAINGSGMARVDFFLKENGVAMINEVNTIPGFSRFSMYPKLWEVSGIGYQELLDRLIELAFERHYERSKLMTRV